MSRAFVFPGQGAQAVGMGARLAEASAAAREVFEEVDEALGQKLSRLMFEGPSDELTLTENAQPALMTVSMAVLRVLEKEGGLTLPGKAVFVAGHSLGEYTALAAAGALPLSDAARLLKTRGRAMQKAVPVGEGAMAAILGLDLPDVQAIADAAAQGQVCSPANDNSPGQVVVSGAAEAVARAEALAKERGARMVRRLEVSAPFHCALMAPAAEAMKEALGNVELESPAVPLVANVTAEAVSDPEVIRELLIEQVTALVRWRESVLYLKDQGVDTLVELGSGKVLAGLAKRIDREMKALSAETPEDIDALIQAL